MNFSSPPLAGIFSSCKCSIGLLVFVKATGGLSVAVLGFCVWGANGAGIFV